MIHPEVVIGSTSEMCPFPTYGDGVSHNTILQMNTIIYGNRLCCHVWVRFLVDGENEDIVDIVPHAPVIPPNPVHGPHSDPSTLSEREKAL